MATNRDKKTWYDEGIRFECQGSGKCCQSRGQYGFVYLTSDDAKNAAKALKISVDKFVADYCTKDDGHLCIKDDNSSPDCLFLDGNRCKIYEGRPTQCRTWPFWPEVMNAKSWNKRVASFCPGVGQGRLYSKSEIEEILKTQKAADRQLRREHKSKSS
jgi:Fe-S-cluster containining protein